MIRIAKNNTNTKIIKVNDFHYVRCLSYNWPTNDTNGSMSSVWQFSNDRDMEKVKFEMSIDEKHSKK